MGVVIDMPATIVQEANEYAERSGCSFRDLLCLSVEMYLAEQTRKRKAEVSAWTERFNALLDSTESRNDEPYKFNRADAYERGDCIAKATNAAITKIWYTICET